MRMKRIKGDYGFSLIELMVVIAIVGILTAIAALGYSRWTIKFRVEQQIKEMYADLMDARTKAMTRNRSHFLTLASTQYTIRDDSDDDGANETTDAVVANRSNLKYQLSWSDIAQTNIEFNSKGLYTQVTTKTICIRSTENPSVTNTNPTADCIIIQQTRINMGNLADKGGSCNSENCQAK